MTPIGFSLSEQIDQLFDSYNTPANEVQDFAIQNMGERGYHFVSIAHSISSFIIIWEDNIYYM